jgi:hypothetical protein
MLDHDSSLNSKEIHDFLQHIRSQHLDFSHYAHPIPSTTDPENLSAAWNLFKTLSSKEKFEKIFQCLNENNFKLALLSLLNVIKTSSYCVTNGTFICLRSHLENVLNCSQRALEDSSKYEKTKPQETLKFFEFDDNVLWNPEKSEWLLNNICLRSSLANLFLQTNFQQNLQLSKNFFLTGSSRLILEVDSLQHEIDSVLADQFRYMVSLFFQPFDHHTLLSKLNSLLLLKWRNQFAKLTKVHAIFLMPSAQMGSTRASPLSVSPP